MSARHVLYGLKVERVSGDEAHVKMSKALMEASDRIDGHLQEAALLVATLHALLAERDFTVSPRRMRGILEVVWNDLMEASGRDGRAGGRA
jgi:hypothetical protein